MNNTDSILDMNEEESLDTFPEEPVIDKQTLANQERITKIKNEYIQLICRQTDLTEEESRNKLEESNTLYDSLKI